MAKRHKLLVCFAFLLAFGGTMPGQGIAPPLAEYRGGQKIDGSFEIQNNADFPMVTLLEAKSFAVDGRGQIAFRPLDAGISLRMGSSSFIVRPHDARIVFYKATFPSAPASFAIITTMTKAGAETGMRVNLVFPHLIYVYQKDKLAKAEVSLALADGVLSIHNLSQKLGRVQSVHSSHEDLGGFPLYPGQTREVPIKGSKVTVKFEDGFKAEP